MAGRRITQREINDLISTGGRPFDPRNPGPNSSEEIKNGTTGRGKMVGGAAFLSKPWAEKAALMYDSWGRTVGEKSFTNHVPEENKYFWEVPRLAKETNIYQHLFGDNSSNKPIVYPNDEQESWHLAGNEQPVTNSELNDLYDGYDGDYMDRNYFNATQADNRRIANTMPNMEGPVSRYRHRDYDKRQKFLQESTEEAIDQAAVSASGVALNPDVRAAKIENPEFMDKYMKNIILGNFEDGEFTGTQKDIEDAARKALQLKNASNSSSVTFGGGKNNPAPKVDFSAFKKFSPKKK